MRRLAREHVSFSVEGEGSIIGDASIGANPRLVEWGSAPCLVRSTHRPGKIRIIARPTYEGTHAPVADTLEIESIPYDIPLCNGIYQPSKQQVAKPSSSGRTEMPQNGMSDEQRRKELEEVEKQQQDFGIEK